MTPDLADIIYGKESIKIKDKEDKPADAPITEMHQITEDIDADEKEKK